MQLWQSMIPDGGDRFTLRREWKRGLTQNHEQPCMPCLGTWTLPNMEPLKANNMTRSLCQQSTLKDWMSSGWTGSWAVQPRAHIIPALSRQEVVYQCFIREAKNKERKMDKEVATSFTSQHLQTGLRFFVHLFALLSLLSSNSIPSLKKQSKNDSSHLKSMLLTSTLIPDEHNDIMAKSMSSANE